MTLRGAQIEKKLAGILLLVCIICFCSNLGHFRVKVLVYILNYCSESQFQVSLEWLEFICLSKHLRWRRRRRRRRKETRKRPRFGRKTTDRQADGVQLFCAKAANIIDHSDKQGHFSSFFFFSLVSLQQVCLLWVRANCNLPGNLHKTILWSLPVRRATKLGQKSTRLFVFLPPAGPPHYLNR